MNILWLPHAPLHIGRTRTDHLVERLARRHHIIVISFRVHPRGSLWRYLTDLVSHRSRRGPHYDERAVWRFPRASRLNGWLLNRVIERELRRHRHDVLVVAPAPYVTGLLDFAALRDRVSIVCDYLDGGHWTLHREDTEFERLYVKSANAVMCVSRGLLRQALTLNANSHYIPNGVELARYREFRASHTTGECKKSLGIDPATYVVSIIGMTCSARLYFVDAIIDLARKGRNVMLLLVGGSPLFPEIRQRAGEWRRVVRIVGEVPYSDIMTYFMASDLGLSAVDDHPYFHFQSPLKIFEYTAMGKPVLAAPQVDEVVELQLANVRFCPADSESLAREIEIMMASRDQPAEATLEAYDWDQLAGAVELILSAASATE